MIQEMLNNYRHNDSTYFSYIDQDYEEILKRDPYC